MKFYLLWDAWYALKHTWQRRTRGFSDGDLWNADYTIAKHALPIVKALKEQTHSHPGDMTHEEWENTIGEMIYGLEYVVRDSEDSFFEGDFDRAQTGLRLLGAYFQHLWS